MYFKQKILNTIQKILIFLNPVADTTINDIKLFFNKNSSVNYVVFFKVNNATIIKFISSNVYLYPNAIINENETNLSNLQSRVIRNLNGINIPILLYADPPRLFASNGIIKGIDASIVELISSKMNFTYNRSSKTMNSKFRGQFNTNLNSKQRTHIFANLKPILHKNFTIDEHLYPIKIEEICAVLTKFEISSFEKFHRIYSRSTLFLYFAIMTILYIAWICIKKYIEKEKVSPSFILFNLIQSVINGSMTITRFDSKPEIYIVSIILWLNFFIMAVTNSLLITTHIQRMYEEEIKSLEELTERNISLFTKDYFVSTYYNISINKVNSMQLNIKIAKPSQGVAFILPKEYALKLIKTQKSFNDGLQLYLMKDCIMSTLTSYRLAKYAPFKERMDEMILTMFEAGLEQYITIKEDLEFYNSDYKRKVKVDRVNVIDILEFGHFIKFVYIYLGCISIAFIVFLIEMILQTIKLSFMKMIHQL